LILETTDRVGYDGRYAVIVPDHASGSASPRFTVYLLPSSSRRRVQVIGRELCLDTARAVARNALAKHARRGGT